MVAARSLPKLDWNTVGVVTLAHKCTPSASGVYIYATPIEVHGLLVGQRWMYIGQGRDLAVRLSDHQVHTESNRRLRDWLRRPGAPRRLYYALVEPERLDDVERELIRRLEPEFNHKRYPQHHLSN